MSRQIFIVDAFTDTSFSGNPAAVVLLRDDDPLRHDALACQRIAAEMNLSETAFVALPGGVEPGNGKDDADRVPPGLPFGLRWWTPVREVDLCGHATLAAAHALYDAGLVSLHEPLKFETRSGTLRAAPDHDWRGFWLDFPATPPRPDDPPAGLLRAVGLVHPAFAGRSRPPDGYDDATDNDYFDWFLAAHAVEAVEALEPDFRALADALAADPRSRGVIVSASTDRGDGEGDVASRCFYPTYGVDEDPVTGSAHCTIGPYFARQLGREGGEPLDCRQLSRRGGQLRVIVRGDRVQLGGRAVTVMRGRLLV